jgi:CBS domain-containing protein
MLMKVADILAAKGRNVSTVRPNERIETLTHRLRLERIGALIVTSNGVDVEGIISERDIVYGLAVHGRDALDMTASALMNLSVPTCRPEDTIASVMAKLTAKRVRHLAVIEDGRLVGIVSIGDVIKRRLDEVELEANVLRDYAIAR